MFLVASLIAHAALVVTKTWYGPATATFETQFAGNPYDPVTNDIRVRFISPDGKKMERLAYFSDGAWRADLVTPTPGEYTATLIRNGVELPDAPSAESMVLIEDKLDHGFVHVDPDYSNRFRFDDGSPFFPVGHNLAWSNPGKLTTVDQITKMGQSALTWTRLWATSLAGRNPWSPTNDPDAIPGELWPPALDAFAVADHACDLNGIYFQLVLFDHNSLSSGSDGAWAKNPWNAANGGFLKSAGDFFTDTEAKRRAKMWIRYAVARYGSDPNLMAFELIDEVESTDAAIAGRWADIVAWTTEMSTYIRTLDTYDHMITTSSTLQHQELWKSLDYYQPHLFAENPAGSMATAMVPTDKPSFYGEFGDTTRRGSRAALRNALYTALMANRGGLPMYWDWDEIVAAGLYGELASAAKVVKDSDVGQFPVATKLSLNVTGCEARGIGSSGWALLRVIATGSGPFNVQIGGLSVIQGAGTVEVIDLNSGKATTTNVTFANARISMEMPGEDCIVIAKVSP